MIDIDHSDEEIVFHCERLNIKIQGRSRGGGGGPRGAWPPPFQKKPTVFFV